MTDFTLVGPNAGKTIKLGGFQFTDGVYKHANPGEVETLAPFLEEFYSAYIDDRLAFGEKKFAAAMAELKGAKPAAPIKPAPDDKVRNMKALDDLKDDPLAGTAEDPVVDTGTGAALDDAVAQVDKLVDAINALDPTNDDHWTARGLPSTDHLTKVVGYTVKRTEVEALAPSLKRSTAVPAQSAAPADDVLGV